MRAVAFLALTVAIFLLLWEVVAVEDGPLVAAGEPMASLACVLAGAGFGGVALVTRRGEARRQEALEIVKSRMEALDLPPGSPPDP